MALMELFYKHCEPTYRNDEATCDSFADDNANVHSDTEYENEEVEGITVDAKKDNTYIAEVVEDAKQENVPRSELKRHCSVPGNWTDYVKQAEISDEMDRLERQTYVGSDERYHTRRACIGEPSQNESNVSNTRSRSRPQVSSVLFARNLTNLVNINKT